MYFYSHWRPISRLVIQRGTKELRGGKWKTKVPWHSGLRVFFAAGFTETGSKWKEMRTLWRESRAPEKAKLSIYKRPHVPSLARGHELWVVVGKENEIADTRAEMSFLSMVGWAQVNGGSWRMKIGCHKRMLLDQQYKSKLIFIL